MTQPQTLMERLRAAHAAHVEAHAALRRSHHRHAHKAHAEHQAAAAANAERSTPRD